MAAVLGAVILGQAALIAWLWGQRDTMDRPGRPTSADHISETYQGVDFSAAYPGLSDEMIYVDRVHYSGAGARLLAAAIVAKAEQAGLLPGGETLRAPETPGP